MSSNVDIPDIKGKNTAVKFDLKSVLKKTVDAFRNWRILALVIVLLFVVSVVFAVWMFMKTRFDVKNLNDRSLELYNLRNYNIAVLNWNNFIREEIVDMKNLDELIDYNIKLEWMSQNFEEYLHGIQSSYDNFLKYLFLPSLNLWKDPYLWEIDYNLVWNKFLEKNSYNDIDLIDKWSSFIKDLWNNNEYNEVERIEVWDITEEWDEFYIPIKISYITPSYRWFLLLIEKLAVTSNKKNISLINELVYNLWELIKEESSDEILRLQEVYTGFSQDQVIWYTLYKWVKWDIDNSIFINDEVIEKAIKRISICSEDEPDEYCYYKFRDKYRSLPGIAYTIWLEDNKNKLESLKDFFQTMPQIMKIINFTYNGEEVKDLVNYTQKQYKWTIDFRIYWEALHDAEVIEIQQLLWWMCLWVDLTPQNALTQVNSKLTTIWKDTSIDTYTTTRLMEIESLISEISNVFDGLSNYKKAIRTFEIYRMLSEWNICN